MNPDGLRPLPLQILLIEGWRLRKAAAVLILVFGQFPGIAPEIFPKNMPAVLVKRSAVNLGRLHAERRTEREPGALGQSAYRDVDELGVFAQESSRRFPVAIGPRTHLAVDRIEQHLRQQLLTIPGDRSLISIPHRHDQYPPRLCAYFKQRTQYAGIILLRVILSK